MGKRNINWNDYSTRVEKCCAEVRVALGLVHDSQIIYKVTQRVEEIIFISCARYKVDQNFITSILTRVD